MSFCCMVDQWHAWWNLPSSPWTCMCLFQISLHPRNAGCNAKLNSCISSMILWGFGMLFGGHLFKIHSWWSQQPDFLRNGSRNCSGGPAAAMQTNLRQFFKSRQSFSSWWLNQPTQLKNIPSPRLTWNLEMMVWKMFLLFQGSIFRFHVCFQGCKSNWKSSPSRGEHKNIFQSTT